MSKKLRDLQRRDEELQAAMARAKKRGDMDAYGRHARDLAQNGVALTREIDKTIDEQRKK